MYVYRKVSVTPRCQCFIVNNESYKFVSVPLRFTHIFGHVSFVLVRGLHLN